MHTKRTLLAALLLCVAHASAQQPTPEAEKAKEAPAISEETSPGGLWLSDRTIELIIARWTDEIGGEYELDLRQRERVQSKMAGRWTTYLRENRSAIQPLVNEFIEMRLQMEAPSKEQVAELAERALGLFDGFQTEINGGIEDFREELNPLQQAKFEKEILAFSVGMRMARSKLEQWKAGEYEEYEVWEATSTVRRRRHRERMAESGHAPPESQRIDQIAVEVDRWQAYVEEVIRVYGLDEGQRDAANSCLKELRKRALDYRDRRKREIAMLEDRIASHTGDQKELEEITAELNELYGPIDELFQELKRRVQDIPTKTQRERIGEDVEKERERRREEFRKAHREHHDNVPSAQP